MGVTHIEFNCDPRPRRGAVNASPVGRPGIKKETNKMTTCPNCKTEIEKWIEGISGTVILVCPGCKMDFFATNAKIVDGKLDVTA